MDDIRMDFFNRCPKFIPQPEIIRPSGSFRSGAPMNPVNICRERTAFLQPASLLQSQPGDFVVRFAQCGKKAVIVRRIIFRTIQNMQIKLLLCLFA